MIQKDLIFMEHDGAVDDLLSQLLLMTMTDKEIIGINVTPADCFLEPATESTYKILQLFERVDIEIGRSDYNGTNSFPSEWRARPEIINALPMLINFPKSPSPYNYKDASQLLIEKLMNAASSVSILITGPCSNLVAAIKKQPVIKNKIKQVIWMGGAFKTSGNVQTYQHNSSAEWNVYWDPKSANEMLKMNLPLVCIPLDVTNKVPVTRDFLSKLALQANYKISNLAGQFWAMTIDTIPNYYYTYYMWDILATSFLAIPDEFLVKKVRAVVSERPPNAGQTILCEEGYEVSVAFDVNKDAFYKYILMQFQRN